MAIQVNWKHQICACLSVSTLLHNSLCMCCTVQLSPDATLILHCCILFCITFKERPLQFPYKLNLFIISDGNTLSVWAIESPLEVLWIKNIYLPLYINIYIKRSSARSTFKSLTFHQFMLAVIFANHVVVSKSPLCSFSSVQRFESVQFFHFNIVSPMGLNINQMQGDTKPITNPGYLIVARFFFVLSVLHHIEFYTRL